MEKFQKIVLIKVVTAGKAKRVLMSKKSTSKYTGIIICTGRKTV